MPTTMNTYKKLVPSDPSIIIVDYLREPLTEYLNSRGHGTLSSHINWLIRRDLERRGYNFAKDAAE